MPSIYKLQGYILKMHMVKTTGPLAQSRSLLRYVLIVYCIDLETTGEYAF